MRMLFIVLAKLLGIYEIFVSLVCIVIQISRAVRDHSFSGSLIASYSFYGLGVLLALILIFKAEKIADLVKVPPDTSGSFAFDAHSILRAGLLLIGVAMLMRAVPDMITLAGLTVAVEYASKETQSLIMAGRYDPKLYSSALQALFAGTLLLFANRLAGLLCRAR